MLKGLHIVERKLASGKIATYLYAWRGGPRIEANPEDEQAVMVEYLRLTRSRIDRSSVETVSDLVKEYVASSEYRGLKDKTKQSYDAALDRIEAEFHDMELTALEQRGARREIKAWRDRELAGRPRTADMTLTVFNRVLNFGKEQEHITRNPIERIGRLSTTTRRDTIWTDDQIEAFAKSAPRHLVRAMILAKWTGQRQGDLLKLTWAAYDGTYIRLQQDKAGRGKAGRRVKILVSEELKAVLAEIRAEQSAMANHPDQKKRRPAPVNILTTANGQPWQSGFKASWSTAVKDAGIEGVTFHDFRGTFITMAHRAGVLIKDIAEASGHDEKECERVIRQHYLATGSENVIRSLENAREKNKSGTDL
jgi:integrase